MKKGILALVLVLLVSMFTQPCLAAENDLVTFNSYDARKYDSNGIRVIYTFDTTTLAELEKDYNVTVGVLLSADVTESTYETEMVIGKAKIDTTFYSTKEGYVGKCYDKANGNKEFVYAITYGDDEEKTEEKLTKAVSARAYVKLVSKTSGTEEVYYVDSNSEEFGKVLSMKELAENFVATTDKNYPILQRLLNSNLKEMLINKISIDKFSVTGTAGADVSAAIEEKLGYKLPIVTTPYFADSYISAGEDASLAQDVLYKITANGAVINIGYNSASKISAISRFKEFLDANGTTVSEVTETIKEKTKYTVTFNANGGAPNSSQQVTEGEKATKPSDPTREGYTFAGWYNEVVGTTAFDFDSAITEPKTVYAKWTANTYTLSFDTDGGNAVSSKSVTFDSAIGSLTTPTKTGYTFAGWTVDGETVDANTVYKYASDKTAKAVWGTNKYTLSFDTDGGSAVTSKEVTFNVAIGSLSTPTKAGYTFAGWTIDGENIDANATYKYTSNKTAKAIWTANTYTLSFDTDGGSSVSSKTVTYNSEIGTLSTPTRAGYTFTGWTIDGTAVTSSTVYTYTTNKTAKANWTIIKYKITYGEGANDYIEVTQGESFSLPVIAKENYTFLGYFTEKGVQVTDAEGKSLSSYAVTSSIKVVAKYESGADSEEGQLLGNQLKAYYKSTGFAHKISRNPWDLMVYDGKLYVGGGYYGGSWNSAPPMIAYDIEKDIWENADITVKMYEALDADSTTAKWYELPATKSNSNNVSNQSLGIIPVTTDCEISGFRLIDGKPLAIGADSINGNTWADGTVSTSTTTTQKYVVNNLGNYYVVEEDDNGNDRWVEYRNYVLHGDNVYDVVEIDYNGGKTLMFAVGVGGALTPAKIVNNKATRSYVSPKFYLKDGTVYTVTSGDKGIYNFFETSEGLFAYFAYENGSVKKIFKYNFTNNEHRFDEVRDITVDNSSTADLKTYTQSDVDKNGAEVTDRRLWTGFMKSDSYNGYAYITTGNLYKTKTFNDIKEVSAPNNAVVTDLLVKDGRLFALGFVKTNSSTNEYTNYIWVINASDNFTQIREFNTVGAYALSFEKDNNFFYVGLGGPTTHITTSVANVGNILKLSYEPLAEEARYTVTFNANGGTPSSSQTVVVGHSVTKPSDPTRTGYTFAGWYNEAAGTTAFDFNSGITGTKTVYAKWIANNYTLNFDTNGGSSVSSKSVAYNSTVGTLATPTKSGYTFAGWTIDGTKVDSSTVYAYTSDKTAKANWTANKYTLSFDSDGGSSVSSKSVTYNSEIGTLTTPTKSGYTFAGWTIDGEKIDASTVYAYTSDKTAKAVWGTNKYTLSFDTDGGSNVSSKEVTFNMAIGSITSPTKTGYTFAGWTIDGEKVDSSTVYTYTSNKTAKATWTANKYTLSFDSDGGSSVSSKSVTYNSAIGTLSTPTKSGYTFAGWTIDGAKVDSSTVYTYTSNKTAKATWTAVAVTKYKVTYGDGANDYIEVAKGTSFTLPVISKDGYSFLGYFTSADVQVTDTEGKSLSTYVLSSNITVTAKYKRVPTDADSSTGQLLGNPLKLYYKGTSFTHKMSRNPWDLIVYNGKVYLGGGTYDGGWNSAPPMSVYDTASGTWGNVDFTVKMYEALDADSTTKKWYELPATSSSSNNVAGGIKNIPVTTDCEISNFRFINGKPIALGADSINGNTWADGTVSTNTTTTQKYVGNNLGNYYTVEEDENGNERWVEYRNHVLHGTHVYDAIEIDYNGGKTLMFALGTSGANMPVKILKNKDTKSYISAKFYLKDGSSYDGVNNNNRVYNFFKTDEGIFAFYSHQGGTAKKIFKYNVVNGEHRFDEVRDISFGSNTKLYTQSDVNSSGTTISTRRLWTDFMRTETYNGYAYYTTGYLYKTKTFENSATTAITAPNSAIISDIVVRDGKLYALGFKKTNSTTNAYTNYIWSISANDAFTQIRTFTSTGAYALSFDKDEDFFYVGLGGPTTHTTTSVANVGNILKLSINPITE